MVSNLTALASLMKLEIVYDTDYSVFPFWPFNIRLKCASSEHTMSVKIDH